MRARLTGAPPKPSLNFLKRVSGPGSRRRPHRGLALWCIWWLYDTQAFHYPNTEAGRLEAVEDYVPSPGLPIQHVAEGDPLRVLGWKGGKYLYVAYAADNADNVHGILRMERGLNGKYWPVGSSRAPSPTPLVSRPVHQRQRRLAFFLMGDGCRDIYSAKITYDVSLEGATGSNSMRPPIRSPARLPVADGLDPGGGAGYPGGTMRGWSTSPCTTRTAGM